MELSEPGMASIIISSYNYGRYLNDAIDSALAQTYPRTEVIVVDDGSTDDSASVIESYQDRIVSVVKENGGQASSMNAGLREGSGGKSGNRGGTPEIMDTGRVGRRLTIALSLTFALWHAFDRSQYRARR